MWTPQQRTVTSWGHGRLAPKYRNTVLLMCTSVFKGRKDSAAVLCVNKNHSNMLRILLKFTTMRLFPARARKTCWTSYNQTSTSKAKDQQSDQGGKKWPEGTATYPSSISRFKSAGWDSSVHEAPQDFTLTSEENISSGATYLIMKLTIKVTTSLS